MDEAEPWAFEWRLQAVELPVWRARARVLH
jgi:hypothetical protein